jgi:nucleotide-binding universal stress UspA family protein
MKRRRQPVSGNELEDEIMKFPIFYGALAPDMVTEKTLHGATLALDVAAALDAQLSVSIGALLVTPPNVLGSSMVSSLVASENKRWLDAAKAVQEQFDRLAAASKIPAHSEVINDDLIGLGKRFAVRARLHGLVVFEHGILGEMYRDELIEPLLFGSGRPVLIFPNKYSSQVSFDRALIAWDGGLHAARAVWSAIPLLQKAASIDIVTVTGEKNLSLAPVADTLAPMLAFLGSNINVTVLETKTASAAERISDYAASSGANFVVQGAYGRSRWLELVLGGVTREMLNNSKLPVLMAH